MVEIFWPWTGNIANNRQNKQICEYRYHSTMASNNLADWLTLYLTPGLGPTGCMKLVEAFGSAADALKASQTNLRKVPGLRKNSLAAIGTVKQARVQQEIDQAARFGVTIICQDDHTFPELLRHIHNPPVILYVKGDVELLNKPGLGIVGSRAASSYGLEMATSFAARLAGLGLNIISGLALGVDGAAHRGALQAAGKTVAILGCGLDIVYPAQHQKLYDKIAANGAIISEYPFGTRPENFRFPARNRIISGMALGVLIIEAAKRSGSLITAHLAMEQGREVFALPGRVDSVKSEGTHRLLQEGAKLVLSESDILDELQLGFTSLQTETPAEANGTTATALCADEEKVCTILDVYGIAIDEIIFKSELTAARVNEILLLLELKGLVETLPGNQFKILRQP